MWRSVFLHEFPDGDIRRFQAIPGTPTPASLALDPVPEPPHRNGSVPISPGRGFEYTLAAPLDQVIGVSARIRLRFPLQGGGAAPVRLMRVGETAEFRIRPPIDPFFNRTAPAHSARALLRIGATEIPLGDFMLPHEEFVDLRFDWHTSGQARFVFNGELAGYHNAVAPERQLEVAGVAFGQPGPPSQATNPHYDVSRVFVRALRRPDPLARFETLLPPVEVETDDRFEKCRQLAIRNVLRTADRLRELMATVNQGLSRPWTQGGGPPEGPFTAQALELHALALQALEQLGRMMRRQDFSEPDAFLDPITRFLEIVHEAFPAEFDALAAELAAAPALPPDCVDLLARQEAHEAGYGPVVDLLAELDRRIRDLAGVS